MALPGKPIDEKNSVFALARENAARASGGANGGGANEPPPLLGAPGGTREPPPKPEESGSALFVPRKPLYSFEQIVLPGTVRTQFAVLKSRIKNHRLLYGEWELDKIDPQGRHIAFNLYGVPGTGKTMCVEAVAHELGKAVIDVNYAELESKYVGETGKNITAAFKAADESGALLFFDEADSILGRRMTHVTQAADHGVNVARAVMLKQLDRFEGIVAFATNLARNFDTAFVRRIAQHIEIPLPDGRGREAIWLKMVSPKVPGRDTLDWARLVEESAGFAGGDIKNAAVNALARLADVDAGSRSARTEWFIEEVRLVANAKRHVGSPSAVETEEVVVENPEV
jgi:SpoVK/Ycf46/Vps4 family AAA+-type ATPase